LLNGQGGTRIGTGLLIGQLGTDGAQGIVLGIEYLDQYDRVMAIEDPRQRTDALMELLRSGALAGGLLFLSVQGAKKDLGQLGTAGAQGGPGSAGGAGPGGGLGNLAAGGDAVATTHPRADHATGSEPATTSRETSPARSPARGVDDAQLDQSQTSGAGRSNAHNAAEFAKLNQSLGVAQAAEPLIESLRATGRLPANYVTKSAAVAAGWTPGKPVGSAIPGAQIGGDVFQNTSSILPSTPGRVWYETDVGLSSTVSRSKQPGTRLLYSNDGLLYVTSDHYNSVHPIGRWK
jgi:ribonuclease